MPNLPDTTILIKTFERGASVARLLDSLQLHYPDVPVIVVDDSRQPTVQSRANVSVIRAPHNCGLSEGRNIGLAAVKTDLFVLMDDDFVVVRGTRLDEMRSLLLTNDLDIVGGRVVDVRAGTLHYESMIRIAGTRLQLTPIKVKDNTGIHPCDTVLNFFIARAAAVRSVLWDPELPVCEHLDFFIRAKRACLRTAYAPSVHIVHDKVQLVDSPYYRQIRTATLAPRIRVFEKYGLTEIQAASGIIAYIRDLRQALVNGSKVRLRPTTTAVRTKPAPKKHGTTPVETRRPGRGLVQAVPRRPPISRRTVVQTSPPPPPTVRKAVLLVGSVPHP